MKKTLSAKKTDKKDKKSKTLVKKDYKVDPKLSKLSDKKEKT